MTLLANAVIMGGRAVQGDLSNSFGSNEYFLFSIFRHIPTYTGPCIEVERGSDNTTLDIGFDASGLLNTSEIETFCSGTTGKVIKFYDQSTNTPGSYGGYVSNSYATSPTIYASGAVIVHTTSGLPCLSFDSTGSERLTSGAFTSTTTTATTQFGVVEGTGGIYAINLYTSGTSQRYNNIGKNSSGTLRLISRKTSATSNIIEDYTTGVTAESIIGGKIESGEMVGADNGSIIATRVTGTDVLASATAVGLGLLTGSTTTYSDIELSFACTIIGELTNTEMTDFQDVVNEAYGLY